MNIHPNLTSSTYQPTAMTSNTLYRLWIDQGLVFTDNRTSYMQKAYQMNLTFSNNCGCVTKPALIRVMIMEDMEPNNGFQTTFYDTEGGSINFIGIPECPTKILRPINRDRFKIKWTKTFKLTSASLGSPASGTKIIKRYLKLNRLQDYDEGNNSKSRLGLYWFMEPQLTDVATNTWIVPDGVTYMFDTQLYWRSATVGA